MFDMTCKKTMQRCNTPGMCAPHGGCQTEKSEWQSGYDEGRRMGTKHMYAEVERLKAENEALRKDAEIGRLVFHFFDRMDDPADCDPLEKSAGEFLRAVFAAMAKAVQT